MQKIPTLILLRRVDMHGTARKQCLPALWLCVLALCLQVATPASAQAPDRPPNVVLVTLDGVRVQEMFGGLDAATMRSELASGHPPPEGEAAYGRYRADTAQARREKLMPFFWGHADARTRLDRRQRRARQPRAGGQ